MHYIASGLQPCMGRTDVFKQDSCFIREHLEPAANKTVAAHAWMGVRPASTGKWSAPSDTYSWSLQPPLSVKKISSPTSSPACGATSQATWFIGA